MAGFFGIGICATFSGVALPRASGRPPIAPKWQHLIAVKDRPVLIGNVLLPPDFFLRLECEFSGNLTLDAEGACREDVKTHRMTAPPINRSTFYKDCKIARFKGV
jgi:hypothetical protein